MTFPKSPASWMQAILTYQMTVRLAPKNSDPIAYMSGQMGVRVHECGGACMSLIPVLLEPRPLAQS